MHHAEVIFQNYTIQIIEYNPRIKKKTISVLAPKDLEKYYSCPVHFSWAKMKMCIFYLTFDSI